MRGRIAYCAVPVYKGEMGSCLKIGTRASPLAMAQTELVVRALIDRHPDLAAPGAIEIVKITTSGDQSQAKNTPLAAEKGGKALFVQEIEEAIVSGRVDCGVHSLKDMPPLTAPALVIAAVLPREDPRDALISLTAQRIEDLPFGARFGTCSPRRQALLLARRPDLKIEVFRGNVDTRLRKLEEGIVDATLLAVAGLKRLGKHHLLDKILEPDVMLPAAAQGAIGIEVRSQDHRMRELIATLNCPQSERRVTAERAFLRIMDGTCRTPLAALMGEADPEGRCRFDVLAADLDGRNVQRLSYVMAVKHLGDAERLGRQAGEDMRALVK